MTTDPFATLRDALAATTSPCEADVQRQRERSRMARAGASTPPRSMRRYRRPTMIAIAGAAAAAFVAFALLPSGDSGREARDANPGSGLRLVTASAGGAFDGLKLESASAAEVLQAAGRSAADGVPAAGSSNWTFTRTESEGDLPVDTTHERWISPDGERTFSISATTVSDSQMGPVGRSVSIQYEHLSAGTIGSVSWGPANGSTKRQATWNIEQTGSNPSFERHTTLLSKLRDVQTKADVAALLDELLSEPGITFRNGSICEKNGTCGGSGLLPSTSDLAPETTKRLQGAGMLLSALSSNVYPSDVTRAAYDYIASLPESATSPAEDSSGDVILSFSVRGPQLETIRSPQQPKTGDGVGYESRPVPGTSHNTKAVARIDGKTGRIVQLNPNPGVGDISYREVEAGLARGPGIGGELCGEFPDACDELRTLHEELQTDPKAQFHGVIDWMQIQQFCDGLVDRDGKPVPGDVTPLSVQGDEASIATRDACIKRESESALER